MNSIAEQLKAAKTVREAMIAIVDIRLTLTEILSVAVDVAENLGAHPNSDLADTDDVTEGAMSLDAAMEAMSRHLLCEHNGHCMGEPNAGGFPPLPAGKEGADILAARQAGRAA